MSKMTEAQINSAKIAAKAAAYADNRGDVVAREEAMNDLFVAAGYWKDVRGLNVRLMPPKMVRMPAGRSVPWEKKRYDAMQAWASA